MSVTTRGTEGDSHGAGAAPAGATGPEADTLVGTFSAGVTTDHCATCGSSLAPDQRYCVECGTRRGKPRFEVASGVEPVEAVPVLTGRRWSPSATLLAGIATLLLALGVGVLIGESSNNTPKNGGIHVVVNGGGGSGGSTSTPSSGTGSSSSTSSSSSTKSKSKSKATKQKIVHKITPPASSGVNPNVTKTPTVKPGGSCTAGTPGCQGGKETGNFF